MIIVYKKYLSTYYTDIINYESKTIYHGLYSVTFQLILKK